MNQDKVVIPLPRTKKSPATSQTSLVKSVPPPMPPPRRVNSHLRFVFIFFIIFLFISFLRFLFNCVTHSVTFLTHSLQLIFNYRNKKKQSLWSGWFFCNFTTSFLRHNKKRIIIIRIIQSTTSFVYSTICRLICEFYKTRNRSIDMKLKFKPI